LRRVISSDTAATLTGIMEQVVTDGTAKRARIDGFTIAGKTGTAQKLINGRYSHSDHNASFIGFLPSRNPAIAIVVVIDSAKGPNGDHGGTVAAPIFQRIAEASLRYLGIAPTVNPMPAGGRGPSRSRQHARSNHHVRSKPRATDRPRRRRRPGRNGSGSERNGRTGSGPQTGHARPDAADRRRWNRRGANPGAR
jgi:membrane peptidoglycan carboxypeptidase